MGDGTMSGIGRDLEPGERIFLLADDIGATQAISFIRPLKTLCDAGRIVLRCQGHSKSGDAVEASYREFTPSILVLSRYTQGSAKPLIDMARLQGVPILYHIDDDLLKVPMSLGKKKYDAYNRPERLAHLRENMNSSDLVYASTAELGQALAGNGVTVPIHAGDIYCSIDPATIGPVDPATGPVIGFMGTGGHAADLEMITPALEALMEQVPELQFEVFGTIAMPAALRRFGGRIRSFGAVSDYAAFLARLGNLGWWVGLAPLEDSPFNRCKADTKWVEYSHAGMATVASNVCVYQRAAQGGCAHLAQDAAAWHEKIFDLIRDRAGRQRMVEAARSKIATSYSDAALSRQILKVFSICRANGLAAAKTA